MTGILMSISTTSGRSRGREREGLGAIGRLTDDGEARRLKDQPETGADQFLVVGHQDAQRARAHGKGHGLPQASGVKS